MKCMKCGNGEMFIESYKGWDKVYYEPGTDTVLDSKGLDIEATDDPRECGVCGGTDIREDEEDAKD